MLAANRVGQTIFVGFFLCQRFASAQTLDLLVQGGTGPAVGALVKIQDSTRAQIVHRLTDERGRLTIRLPGAGRYVVRADAIGFDGADRSVVLQAGQRLAVEFSLEANVYQLAEITVVGPDGGPCELEPRHVEVVGRLWSEAHKALEAERITRHSGSTVLLGRLYEQTLNLAHEVVETSESPVWATSRRSFFAVPSDQLHRHGYVQAKAGETSFYAPDGDLLLSEQFLADHCLSAGGSSDDRASVGLKFRPIPGRAVPEVAGTVWLDRETAELQRLDFRYVNWRAPLGARGIGGCVDFLRLPNGGWIVGRWHITMPVQAKVVVGPWGRRDSLVGYRRAGGDVVPAGTSGTTGRRGRCEPPSP